jgi:rhodanese-related sulfurtransferase
MATSDFTLITPEQARSALEQSTEIALLDVREYGQYGEGHAFRAVNIPYSRLEIDAHRLLPSTHAYLVLIDDGDGVAEKAVARLHAMGFRQLSIIRGGVAVWASAGFTLFKGVNLPSKAFGELVEHELRTPSLSPDELREWKRTNVDFLLLDGRTPAEHAKMTIPGAINCPNGELIYRIAELLENDETPIVVHCAGRTRSIIGAETLRLLALPNPVYALRNGTQGWAQAGYELEFGAVPRLAQVEKFKGQDQKSWARDFRARHSIPAISITDLSTWQAAETRSVYIFDVRTIEEFQEKHFPGAIHAPGGQLVQATDHWIVVRGARIVLIDDNGLRASMTAYWLRRMGHDAAVLDLDVTAIDKTERAESSQYIAPKLSELPLSELKIGIYHTTRILDLNPSHSYRVAHIAGAQWAIRPKLARALFGLKQPDHIVLVSADRRLSELAAVDLREMGFFQISYAPGTAADWQRSGLPLETSPDTPCDAECIDFLYFVHDRHDGNLEAARRYLEWETNLINQMDEFDFATFELTKFRGSSRTA